MQTAPTPRPGFGRIAAIILTSLLGLSMLVLALTPAIAPLFLYLPTHDAQARESLLARDDIEPLTIQSNGAELSGYFLHGSDGPAPLVIYFNGNHENASAFMLELVDTPERLAAFGLPLRAGRLPQLRPLRRQTRRRRLSRHGAGRV